MAENKVDTKLLVATAETIEPAVKQLSTLFDQWQHTIASIRGDWQGDTSDDIRNTAAQLKASSDALLASLSNYPKTLKEMAGIYEKTEKNTQETGKRLKFGDAFK